MVLEDARWRRPEQLAQVLGYFMQRRVPAGYLLCAEFCLWASQEFDRVVTVDQSSTDSAIYAPA
jgi:hypothetical protein